MLTLGAVGSGEGLAFGRHIEVLYQVNFFQNTQNISSITVLHTYTKKTYQQHLLV